MTVCYWGTYDRDYPRNRILIQGLRANQVVVREMHAPLWGSTAEKVRRARGRWLGPGLVLRAAWAYLRLGARFLASPRPDFLFVGYSGHFDVFPAWVLSRVRRVPLVFDAFLSLYDSLVLDRGALAPRGLKARALAWVDRWSCRLADRVLLDTSAHREFFCRQFGVPPEKFWILPIGADDTVFTPAAEPPGNGHQPPTVLHFGRYIPLHGMETVVRAAALLEESGEPCRFLLVGDGEERPRIEALAHELGLRSVEFVGSQSPEMLAETVRRSDLCLGIFGTTGKAARVVPNKVYEAMASGKPILTADSPAAREMLTDGVDCLLCESGNPQSLADAIRRARSDLELANRLGSNARRRFELCAAPAVIGQTLARNLQVLGGAHAAS
ncbi:MAG TPA: glycosyltransferase family 4 protein [Candidatus Polarisedimenticolia bacterium]|nr:glycosyltransferase family 4 protein [Candidatus Polarisedimenticolia bacterium]